MKALEIMNKLMKAENWDDYYPSRHQCNEAMKELESLQKEKDLLEEYVQFARHHIETYRCSCGSLGRIGYLCSNKECSEV